jgi:dolichol kinase
VLVAGIGDGLAEPVGVRFGRHTYRTRALFTDRTYTRSLEGSACVLASGFLAVFLLRSQLDPTQLVLALAIIPLAMTLAEAWSPHTWDGPFLYLVGGSSTVATLELSRLLQ